MLASKAANCSDPKTQRILSVLVTDGAKRLGGHELVRTGRVRSSSSHQRAAASLLLPLGVGGGAEAARPTQTCCKLRPQLPVVNPQLPVVNLQFPVLDDGWMDG